MTLLQGGIKLIILVITGRRQLHSLTSLDGIGSVGLVFRDELIISAETSCSVRTLKSEKDDTPIVVTAAAI